MPSKPPEVHVAVLCDDVRQEVNGKLSLMGLFTDFNVSNYQQPLPKFTVFVRLGFHSQGRRTLKLEARSHEGDFGVGFQGPIEANNQTDGYQQYIADVNFVFENVKIPREGLYSVDVSVDDHVVVQIPFVVKTEKPPVTQ